WRVRHRLLVTWIFVGVVPIVLVAMLVGEGLYFLLGQTVGYMTTSEIKRQNTSFENLTATLALNLRLRKPTDSVRSITETFVRRASDAQKGPVGAIVHSGREVVAVPTSEVIPDIPTWLTSNFVGLIKDQKNDRYYLGAYTLLDAGPETQV